MKLATAARAVVAGLAATTMVLLGPAGSASAATTTVDNATAGRFTASTNWGASSWAGQKYGADYRFATPYTGGSDAAWFTASIPAARARETVRGRWKDCVTIVAASTP